LIPYFKAGLENNEFCLWITCDPISVEKAYATLKQAIPDFDQYIEKQSIEIRSYLDWHLKEDKFDAKTIINGWKKQLYNVLDRGFDGMRVNGNETWLKHKDWKDIMNYESELNKALHNQPIIVFCTYPLSNSTARSILDVAHTHGCVVSKRKGKWEILEAPEIKENKAQLKRRSDKLEQRVAERTSELVKVIEELKNEIGERKKTEEKLIQEKKLCKTIIESFPGIFKIMDKNNRILDWNHMLEVLSGYTAEEIPHLNALKDFHDARDQKRILELMQKAYNTGKVSAEVDMRMKDGRILNFYYIARPINYNGKPCLIASGIDMTERKKAEAQIIKEKELSNQILDSIPGLVGLFDENLRFLRWNKNFEIVSGYTPEEIPLLHGVNDFFDNEHDKKRIFKILREMFMKGFGSAEVSPIMKNGRVVTLYFNGRRINYEGKPCMLCIGVDITKRKKAEKELSLAYKRLTYHVDNTPLAIIECDRNMVINRWSKRAEEIFGWKESEVLGKNMFALKMIYEKDKSIVEQQVEELLNGSGDRNQMLNRNYTKEGNVIYCEWYNSALRNQQGNIVTILSLVHDVTERRNAEETMHQSYQQIRSLTEHLQNIREEERTYIAREIHDELGQQLTVLKMDVAWLSKKVNGKNDAVEEKIKDLLNLLDNTVQSVRRISSELRPGILDDLGLAAAIEWHLNEFEKRSGVQTHFNYPEEERQLPGPVKTNLYRIFQESLTNVARHAQASEVTVNLAQQDGQITLTIKDNGQGFDQHLAGKKRTLGILGMKERAAMMGGTYEIQSEPGIGTNISVVIPLPNTN
jgi:PAS domain S-box-containing protein